MPPHKFGHIEGVAQRNVRPDESFWLAHDVPNLVGTNRAHQHRQDRHAHLRPRRDDETITIEVKGDSKKEANETFYLDLFGNPPAADNALFPRTAASARS